MIQREAIEYRIVYEVVLVMRCEVSIYINQTWTIVLIFVAIITVKIRSIVWL